MSMVNSSRNAVRGCVAVLSPSSPTQRTACPRVQLEASDGLWMMLFLCRIMLLMLSPDPWLASFCRSCPSVLGRPSRSPSVGTLSFRLGHASLCVGRLFFCSLLGMRRCLSGSASGAKWWLIYLSGKQAGKRKTDGGALSPADLCSLPGRRASVEVPPSRAARGRA